MFDYVLVRRITALLAMVFIGSCASEASLRSGEVSLLIQNPVAYFEIPVTDMDRATKFYEAVFSVVLNRTVIDGHDMALFPFDESGRGISGALAEGDSYVPSKSGPRIYFFVGNIDEALDQAVRNGGNIAYPKTSAGDFWVAEFEDSEGNQVALSSPHE